MNTMVKYALMGVGFTAISTVLGADGVRTAHATPGPAQVDVVNTPSVSVVSMPTAPVNVAGNVGITGNVGILGTPTVNVASFPGGPLNVAGNVGLVSGTTVLADPSQVVTLQAESSSGPGLNGVTYGGSTASGKAALVVQNAGDAQQPFGETLPFQPQGTPTSMGAVVMVVPAHKRAVVERVVVGAGVPTGQVPTLFVFFGAALPPGAPSGVLGATETLIPTKLTSDSFGLDRYLAAQSVRYYVEPTANVFVLVEWNTATPDGVFPDGAVTISGYFVDAP